MNEENTNLPHISDDEIRILQELGPGWEEIWGSVTAAMFGSYDAKKDSYNSPLQRFLNPDCRVEDVIRSLWENLREQTLLNEYDFSYPGANIYAFLCGRARNLCKDAGRNDTCTKQLTNFSVGYFPTNPSKDERELFDPAAKSSPREWLDNDELLDKDYQADECLQVAVENHRIVLKFPDEAAINKTLAYSGLQLYPGLNHTVERMQKLLSHVEANVQRSVKRRGFLEDAAKWIEDEHAKAQEHHQQRWDKVHAERFNHATGKLIDSDFIKNREQLAKISQERLIEPLSNPQVAALYDLTEDTAAKQRQRYFELMRRGCDDINGVFPTDDELLTIYREYYPDEKGGKND